MRKLQLEPSNCNLFIVCFWQGCGNDVNGSTLVASSSHPPRTDLVFSWVPLLQLKWARNKAFSKSIFDFDVVLTHCTQRQTWELNTVFAWDHYLIFLCVYIYMYICWKTVCIAIKVAVSVTSNWWLSTHCALKHTANPTCCSQDSAQHPLQQLAFLSWWLGCTFLTIAAFKFKYSFSWFQAEHPWGAFTPRF